jgi:hypothetical protein
MSVAATLRSAGQLPRGTVARGLLAGAAWGVAMAVGLPLLAFMNCSTLCLSEIALTAAISIPAGIATIGPLAAFGRTPPRQRV